MLTLPIELRRKLFHFLGIPYALLYVLLPRRAALVLFGIAVGLAVLLEFWRLRRWEANAWLLERFGGIHRPEEISQPSGIFWTLLGTWLTLVVFTNQKIVLAALGFLIVGDAAAALIGQRAGVKVWPWNPQKTKEGTIAFFITGFLTALLFVRWPVALVGTLTAALVESRKLPYNDNLWIPTLGGLALSLCSLVLGL